MSKKLMRKKLALMLANLKKKRKYYCECEYLEATGTQYINTGLLSTANSQVDVVFGFTSMESGVANNVGVFGGRNATTTNTFTFFKIASGNPQYFRFDYNGQVNVATANQMTWNTSSKYRFQYNGTNYTTINTTTGESVSGVISPATTFTQYPIHLFAVNTAGAVGINLIGRIYRFWYTDGTTTIDLVPVLDWNYKPCMYDKVSGQLFYNQGTGDFVAGREIHQVEYIETDGTSYINTLYTPSGSTETEITTMLKDQTTSRFMFGCRTAQSSSTYACLAHNQNRIGYRVGDGSYLYSSGYNEVNVKHTYKIANGVFYRDDVVVDTSCQGATVSPNSPLALLTINTNNALDTAQSFIGNLYSCIIKDNNVLVRYYIPAIDENGVGFVFDRVSHTIYDNAGTGAFKYPERELEYIESTGTQYIDTGFKGKNNLEYKTKINYTSLSTSSSNGIGGEYLGNASAYIGMVRANGHFTYLYYNTAVETTKTLYTNTDYVIDSIQNSGSQIVKIDDEVISNGTLTGTFTSTRNIFLFAICSTNDAADVFGSLKMSYCQILDNGTMVRDFIPCFKDGVSGMFDKVNNVFYNNSGSGTFSVGKIKEEEYITDTAGTFYGAEVTIDGAF